MQLLHHGIPYDLPDDWWIEAGMPEFVRRDDCYKSGESPWSGLTIAKVPVAEVEPLQRHGTHGVFNDNPDSGSAHDCVANILRGLRADSAIPPIEVVRLPAGSKHTFRLFHGAHRFYCAIAASFSYVPAVEVRDTWTETEA
jgi:hypothetical protein